MEAGFHLVWSIRPAKNSSSIFGSVWAWRTLESASLVSHPYSLCRHAGQSIGTRIRYFEIKENPAQEDTFERRWWPDERDRARTARTGDTAGTHCRYFENSNFDTENRTQIVRALIERMPLRQPRRWQTCSLARASLLLFRPSRVSIESVFLQQLALCRTIRPDLPGNRLS